MNLDLRFALNCGVCRAPLDGSEPLVFMLDSNDPTYEAYGHLRCGRAAGLQIVDEPN